MRGNPVTEAVINKTNRWRFCLIPTKRREINIRLLDSLEVVIGGNSVFGKVSLAL